MSRNRVSHQIKPNPEIDVLEADALDTHSFQPIDKQNLRG